jgi:hypothetical protein
MADDLNNMSMEEMLKMASGEPLPEEPQEEEDLNDLSIEDLMAMAEGKAPIPKPDSGAEPESQEASEDDLRALLEDTLSEEELGGGDDEEQLEIAKSIEKIKLRQLANRIEDMAPKNLFPPRKDEIYYFLSSMAGQSAKIRIEDAEEKCACIGKCLGQLETYMISEANFSVEEQEILVKLFQSFSAETVTETNNRNRVFDNFKFGWKQNLKRLDRDIENLKRFALEKQKPIWILFSFYESLSRAYGMCRAQENFKEYAQEMDTQISRDHKRTIVDAFEEVVELAPYYGLKSIDFINRKQAYDAVEKLDLPAILEVLKKKKNSR